MEIINALKADDLLIITADHGCDPLHPGTDHTREYVPLLTYGKSYRGNVNLGDRDTLADVAATIAQFFHIDGTGVGKSFLGEIIT